ALGAYADQEAGDVRVEQDRAETHARFGALVLLAFSSRARLSMERTCRIASMNSSPSSGLRWGRSAMSPIGLAPALAARRSSRRSPSLQDAREERGLFSPVVFFVVVFLPCGMCPP